MKFLSATQTQDRGFWADAARATVIGGILLTASLLNFLGLQQYPVLTIEVALLLAALIGVAAATGLLYAAGHRYLRAIIEILLLLVTLSLNFDGWTVLIGTAAVAMAFNRHLLTFLGIAGTVVLLTELPFTTYLPPDPFSSSEPLALATGDTSLPPLVHIILDEHIGIEGLTEDNSGRATGDELRSFYLLQNFYVAGGAYSESLYTEISIPSLLNFGEPHSSSHGLGSNSISIVENRYFDFLHRQGYAINVFQTPYMDYCAHDAVAKCWINPKTLSLSIRSNGLSSTQRAIILGRELAPILALIPASLGESRFDLGIRRYFRPTSLSAIETLEVVATQMRQGPRGSATFVHVLAPHRPFFLDISCNVKPITEWSYDLHDLSRDGAQATYYDQLKCLKTKLRPILDAAGKDSIVIVQGDHGSRNTTIQPSAETIGAFSKMDMIASFSTLFAVRAPGIPSEYDRRPLPLGLLIRELAESNFRRARPTVPAAFSPSVTLNNSKGMATARHALPDGWPSE